MKSAYPLEDRIRASAKPGQSLASLGAKPVQPARTEVKVIHHHKFTSTGNKGTAMGDFGGSPFTNPFVVYEALAQSDDRTAITTAGLGPMLVAAGRWLPSPMVNFQRLLLAAISEYLYDNSGLVSYGVDMLSNYGVPVVPKSATKDPQLAEQYNAFFMEWAKTADYSGRFSLWKLQELASKAIDKQGDQGFIM